MDCKDEEQEEDEEEEEARNQRINWTGTCTVLRKCVWLCVSLQLSL